MKHLFTCILAMSMATAIHAGTGAGGGDDSDRNRRGQQIEDEMRSEGGSPSAYLYEWCENTSRVLRKELRRAKVLTQGGKLNEAKNVLVTALRAAGGSFNSQGIKVKPMTKKLIDRGIKYLNVINNLEWQGPERFKLISQLNFLMEYVELIVDTESTLDRPYHIPYHYGYNQCRNGCDGFSVTDYEAAFVNQMRKELNFVADKFTMSGPNGRSMPIGSAEIYLKAAEILSFGVATDLSENLYAYQNSCSVVDLESLSDVLKEFNWFGDETYFMSEPHAVDETTSELRRVAEALYPKGGQDYGYRPAQSSPYGYPQSGCRR